MAVPLEQQRVVGRLDPFRLCLLVRLSQHTRPERLGGLREPELLPVDGPLNDHVIRRFLHRVPHGDGDNGAPHLTGARNHPLDHVLGQERADGVVHQHHIQVTAGCLEGMADGILPPGTARDHPGDLGQPEL